MAKIIGAQPLYDYDQEIKIYAPGGRDLKITVIGGGHGQSTALRGLKHYTRDLTGIVAVSDDGGGSGMLREDMGILPPGDIRNCIMALSDAEPTLQKLMSFRFSDSRLNGQSFGNLFLAAMNEISDSFEEAVSRMCEALSVRGRVLPVTNENINLEAEYENGETTLGESKIFLDKKLNGSRIREVRLVPCRPKALEESVRAILDADIVVIGPGSLYTSVIPNFLADGITEALAATGALRIFVMNVMTQEGETEGYSGPDHIRAFCQHAAEGLIDVCIANNAEIDEEVLSNYRMEDSEPIELMADEIREMGIRVYEAPLTGDTEFARHDSAKLASAVIKVYRSMRT